jgi:hypothetical protein
MTKINEVSADLGGDAFVYLSHSYDGRDSKKPAGVKAKNPLKYESKLRYVRSCAPRGLTVVNSKAINMFFVLHEIWKQGYKKAYVVLGEDREDAFPFEKYNGYGKESDPMYYKFNEVPQVISAGARNEESEDPSEQASASLLRKLAIRGEFDGFKSFSGTKKLAQEMYDEVRYEMEIGETDD